MQHTVQLSNFASITTTPCRYTACQGPHAAGMVLPHNWRPPYVCLIGLFPCDRNVLDAISYSCVLDAYPQSPTYRTISLSPPCCVTCSPSQSLSLSC
jgi:hypothetical protein